MENFAGYNGFFSSYVNETTTLNVNLRHSEFQQTFAETYFAVDRLSRDQ